MKLGGLGRKLVAPGRKLVAPEHECPFCHSRVAEFLPFGQQLPVLAEKRVVGGGYRLNALCPVCGSLDRERLVYLYLLRKTGILAKPRSGKADAPLKLLHVAPSAGLAHVLRCAPNIDYLSGDIASEQAMVRLDVTDLQFPDDTFDVIICNHVLEHVPDDARAMAELHRTLKPQGWAILQVPLSLTLEHTFEDPSITSAPDRETAFGQADHVRIYAADYTDRLTRAGFVVTVFDWTAEPNGFGGTRNRYGLGPNERVHVAVKPAQGTRPPAGEHCERQQAEEAHT